jgi:ABC-2 type transport system permease protein
MSGWQSVAKKDFTDALRSRRLAALVVLFVLFVVGIEVALVELFPDDIGGAAALVAGLVGPATLLVPLIGLVTGYRCIAGERESGSHKLLLSLPHSRRDVVLGKLVGRTGIVSAAILGGFLAGGVVAFVLIGGFAVLPFVVYFAITLLYAAAFVGLGVGISASTGSTSVAVAGGLGAFFVFQFFWAFLVGLLQNQLLSNAPDVLFRTIERLSPLLSYTESVGQYVGEGGGAAGDALYQQGWFALLVLVAWVVVPVGLGYLRFRSVDL